MKRVFLSVSMLIIITAAVFAQSTGQACDPAKEKPNSKNTKAVKGNYGVAVSKEGAVDVKQLPEKMKDQKELFVKIQGDVITACQVKGCWMTADLGDGKSMRIRFKDYAFFVPKDSGGKKFYAQGIATWSETSVAELQHYAEDAGKSKEDIAKITEPKRELIFMAEGVLLEKK